MSFKGFFRRYYLAVIIVLAVISIAVGAVYGLFPLPTFEKPTKQSVQPQFQFQPHYASPGQLVSGFPAELVLDPKAAVKESYSIDYGENTNQYTTSFNSNESMESLFSSYKKYFGDNGWSITNEITKYPTSRGLYAVKGAADASVAIIEKGEMRQVMASYVKK